MKKVLAIASVVVMFVVLLFPSAALATQAKGRVSHGYYWLLTDNGRWQCRSTTDRRIQKHQKCLEAGAVKPKRGKP